MQTYAEALKAFLAKPENKVTDLADKVKTHQPNITRYASGERFPNADMARLLDSATDGEVPFSLWQSEFLSRSGIAA
jgi:ribosome-binding protein aMBF1 (putative translation factor)